MNFIIINDNRTDLDISSIYNIRFYVKYGKIRKVFAQ